MLQTNLCSYSRKMFEVGAIMLVFLTHYALMHLTKRRSSCREVNEANQGEVMFCFIR